MSDTSSGVPPTHESKNVGGLLNRKVGGMPVKWLALGVLVVVSGWFIYRHFNPKTTITTTDTGDVAATDTTGDDSAFYGSGGGGFGSTGTTTANSYLSPTGAGITTNPQWVQNATNGLVGTGAYSGATVIDALNTYVNGGAPTPAQTGIVNAAIAAYGAPPEPIVATLPVAPASVTGGFHTTVTKTGDTLQSITQHTYGLIDPALVSAMESANPTLIAAGSQHINSAGHSTNPLKPGQTIRLPIYTTGTLP